MPYRNDSPSFTINLQNHKSKLKTLTVCCCLAKIQCMYKTQRINMNRGIKQECLVSPSLLLIVKQIIAINVNRFVS